MTSNLQEGLVIGSLPGLLGCVAGMTQSCSLDVSEPLPANSKSIKPRGEARGRGGGKRVEERG